MSSNPKMNPEVFEATLEKLSKMLITQTPAQCREYLEQANGDLAIAVQLYKSQSPHFASKRQASTRRRRGGAVASAEPAENTCRELAQVRRPAASSNSDLGSICYYDLLGIERTASDKEIRNAFRKLSLLHHPDKRQANPDGSDVMYQLIHDAYQVLSDARTRALYDKYGRRFSSSLIDIFESHKEGLSNLFGGERFKPYFGDLSWVHAFAAEMSGLELNLDDDNDPTNPSSSARIRERTESVRDHLLEFIDPYVQTRDAESFRKHVTQEMEALRMSPNGPLLLRSLGKVYLEAGNQMAVLRRRFGILRFLGQGLKRMSIGVGETIRFATLQSSVYKTMTELEQATKADLPDKELIDLLSKRSAERGYALLTALTAREIRVIVAESLEDIFAVPDVDLKDPDAWKDKDPMEEIHHRVDAILIMGEIFSSAKPVPGQSEYDNPFAFTEDDDE
ncbi:hypothetical protein, variant [Fonticula alba]|nr:hypothetical protein, variant [Fonticula alba]KCV68531.1 hypothetical protein, variant [Fonticula alba]|eukprot:XP_009496963.1 hypothetical protein, variant [Fonticula alba]